MLHVDLSSYRVINIALTYRCVFYYTLIRKKFYYEFQYRINTLSDDLIVIRTLDVLMLAII